LVIEDDADTRDAYVAYLEMAGFIVEAASSGTDGLHLAQLRQPLAILLDLSLTDGDGRELHRRLCNHDRTRDIVVAAVTGRSLVHEERAQFARVFTKPIDLDRVVEWLRELRSSHS
jgi:DNA-binding response OmpR family regulator